MGAGHHAIRGDVCCALYLFDNRLDARALDVEKGLVECIVEAMEDGPNLGVFSLLDELYLSERRHGGLVARLAHRMGLAPRAC